MTWAAELKQTKVELDLFTDVDMLLMVEKGIRDGLTMVSKKHCKAINRLLPDFDPNKPENYLLYLDVNNLYGYAMSQSLPTGNYQWVDIQDESVFKENLLKIESDSPTGYMLEVDLEYTQIFHDDHNDYPLFPHKL